ncbi:MAG: 16S rRNA processing protein RimM [Deltaproteobacteria bacterium]|nr:16S rRNA processing protein RimM [Deltaproteobacteria bacterium]
MTNLLEIGKIVKSIGLKGRVKVRSFLDSPDLLESLDEVFIGNRSDGATPFTVTSVTNRGRSFFLDLEGVSNIETSNVLIGLSVFMYSDRLGALPEGEYYWHQIIGLDVFTGEGQWLGHIENILPTGSNDVYLVSGGEREILLPALSDVVREIDLEKGRMTVTLIDGL